MSIKLDVIIEKICRKEFQGIEELRSYLENPTDEILYQALTDRKYDLNKMEIFTSMESVKKYVYQDLYAQIVPIQARKVSEIIKAIDDVEVIFYSNDACDIIVYRNQEIRFIPIDDVAYQYTLRFPRFSAIEEKIDISLADCIDFYLSERIICDKLERIKTYYEEMYEDEGNGYHYIERYEKGSRVVSGRVKEICGKYAIVNEYSYGFYGGEDNDDADIAIPLDCCWKSSQSVAQMWDEENPHLAEIIKRNYQFWKRENIIDD